MRMAEQNLLYLTCLALTDKFACSRTLGGYCESTLTPGTPHLDSSSNPIAQEGDCTSPGNSATNDIEIKNGRQVNLKIESLLVLLQLA